MNRLPGEIHEHWWLPWLPLAQNRLCAINVNMRRVAFIAGYALFAYSVVLISYIVLGAAAVGALMEVLQSSQLTATATAICCSGKLCDEWC
jgi:hypothetical protein